MSRRCAQRSAAALHRLSSRLSRQTPSLSSSSSSPSLGAASRSIQPHLAPLAEPSSGRARPAASAPSPCRTVLLPSLPLPWPLSCTETAPVRMRYTRGELQTDQAPGWQALLRKSSSLAGTVRERAEGGGVPPPERDGKGKRKRGSGVGKGAKGLSETRGPKGSGEASAAASAKRKGPKEKVRAPVWTGPGDAKDTVWRSAIVQGSGIPDSLIPSYVWTVLNRLKSQGEDAYLVGGSVRDLCLRRSPKDFDVLTTAPLKRARRILSAKGVRAIIVGARFPICHVHIGQHIIEVSSFDKLGKSARDKAQGGPSADARAAEPAVTPSEASASAATSATRPGHPGSPGDAARQGARDGTQRPPVPAWHKWSSKDTARWQDALSRDFTVNALMYDPKQKLLYDYLGAGDDLQKRKLCTIKPAEESFQQDAGRVLRAIRLAGRLRFSLSPDVQRFLRDPRAAEAIRSLDKNRVMMELGVMLCYGAARPSIAILHKFHLLHLLLPHVAEALGEEGRSVGFKTLVKSQFLLDLLQALDAHTSPRCPCHAGVWVALVSLYLSSQRLQPRWQAVLASGMAAGGVSSAIDIIRMYKPLPPPTNVPPLQPFPQGGARPLKGAQGAGAGGDSSVWGQAEGDDGGEEGGEPLGELRLAPEVPEDAMRGATQSADSEGAGGVEEEGEEGEEGEEWERDGEEEEEEEERGVKGEGAGAGAAGSPGLARLGIDEASTREEDASGRDPHEGSRERGQEGENSAMRDLQAVLLGLGPLPLPSGLGAPQGVATGSLRGGDEGGGRKDGALDSSVLDEALELTNGALECLAQMMTGVKQDGTQSEVYVAKAAAAMARSILEGAKKLPGGSSSVAQPERTEEQRQAALVFSQSVALAIRYRERRLRTPPPPPEMNDPT